MEQTIMAESQVFYLTANSSQGQPVLNPLLTHFPQKEH